MIAEPLRIADHTAALSFGPVEPAPAAPTRAAARTAYVVYEDVAARGNLAADRLLRDGIPFTRDREAPSAFRVYVTDR